MNIRQLEYFICLSETLHLSTAAEKMFVTQQALSSAIRKLENELGYPLFDRLPSGLAMTAFGEFFYKKAVLVLADFTSLTHAPSEYESLKSHQLFFPVPFCTLSAFISPLIIAFHAAYPQASVNAQEYEDVAVEEKVEAGQCELGFCVGRPLHPDILEYYPVISRPLCLMIPRDHPLATKEKVSIIQDVLPQQLGCANDRFKVYHILKDIYSKGGSMGGFSSLNLQMDAYNCALMEKQITVSFADISEAFSFRELCPVFPIEKEFVWEVGLCWRKNVQLSPLAKQWVGFVCSQPMRCIPVYSK